MDKQDLKDDTLTETDVKKLSKFSSFREESKITIYKGFVIIKNGSMRGTHWTQFYVKGKKLFYFDSPDGPL